MEICHPKTGFKISKIQKKIKKVIDICDHLNRGNKSF